MVQTQNSVLDSYLGSLRSSAALTVGSWREMIRGPEILPNALAGLTVALVALPLNLALAIACGLPASAGLLTGAVAGLIGGLFGGARLQVTGPEVALAPATLLIIHEHGLEGLFAATILAGLFQVLFGLLRLGPLVRLIPLPVIGGFMAAVCLLVFDTQVPVLLGTQEGPSVRAMLVSGNPFTVDVPTLLTGLAVIGGIIVAPRFLRSLPGPLLGLGVGVALSLLLPGLKMLDPVVAELPTPGLPAWKLLTDPKLVTEGFALAVLASIDSLLCAASIDAKTGSRTRNDQELMAQGLCNLACGMIGGMPVAAAVVRSAAAVDSGATTRLAPIVQSFCLGLALFAFGGWLEFIPLVALAGVLLVVGYRLIDVRLFRALWGSSRSEAAIFLLTIVAIVSTDFVLGVGIGVFLSLVHFASRQYRELELEMRALEPHQGEALHLVHLKGPLFFAAQSQIERLSESISDKRAVIFDTSRVTTMDASGETALARGLAALLDRGVRVGLTGTFSDRVFERLSQLAVNRTGLFRGRSVKEAVICFAAFERQVTTTQERDARQAALARRGLQEKVA